MAVRSRLEAALRPFRLSSGQFMLLTTLERQGPATAASLARELHLSPQAMTRLLRPLEVRDLIDRRPDERHRRRILLSLSDAGDALLGAVRTVTPAVEATVMAGSSEEELDIARRVLARIADCVI